MTPTSNTPKTISYTFGSYVQKKIKRNIAIYGALSTFALGAVAIRFSYEITVADDIGLIGMLSIIGPMLYVFLDHLSGFTTFNEWQRSFMNEKEMDALALTMILPSLNSKYRDLPFIKKIILIILIFILGSGLSRHISIFIWIALLLYTFMFFRYIRCLRESKTCKMIISDTQITIPILGFFKCYPEHIEFNKMKNFEIIGFLENDLVTKEYLFGISLFSIKPQNRFFILSRTIISNESLWIIYQKLNTIFQKKSNNAIKVRFIKTNVNST